MTHYWHWWHYNWYITLLDADDWWFIHWLMTDYYSLFITWHDDMTLHSSFIDIHVHTLTDITHYTLHYTLLIDRHIHHIHPLDNILDGLDTDIHNDTGTLTSLIS